MTRLSEKQVRALGIPMKRSKYNSRKVVVDGIIFDSRKEANKYCELLLLKKAGEIAEIELQPVFELQPAFVTPQGKKVRAITYRADFRVTYHDGRHVVIDTKGYRTKEYLLKKKMFLKNFPEIEFIEE